MNRVSTYARPERTAFPFPTSRTIFRRPFLFGYKSLKIVRAISISIAFVQIYTFLLWEMCRFAFFS